MECEGGFFSMLVSFGNNIVVFLWRENDNEMKYSDFEAAMSPERMRKYLMACANDTKRAMTLYRYNMKLSQEMFAIISCFEVTMRNMIDKEMKSHFGGDWLRDFILPGGQFDSDPRVDGTKRIIKKAYEGLLRGNNYIHNKLLAEMEFGVWKFMFNNVQYRLSGRCLLSIFPNKPTSTPQFRYDNTFIYNELDRINIMRNRIAHHEPICFGFPISIGLQSVNDCYSSIMRLFQWMSVDAKAMLYGLDHVAVVSSRIMQI
ncbi:MAG: Abi family protein [Bacteroidales bacterium]|jgi:hypothetical protein|nr:Abi family protein [Bacteroidales bacterium]